MISGTSASFDGVFATQFSPIPPVGGQGKIVEGAVRQSLQDIVIGIAHIDGRFRLPLGTAKVNSRSSAEMEPVPPGRWRFPAYSTGGLRSGLPAPP